MSTPKYPTARTVFREIQDITSFLVIKGLADDQNMPIRTSPSKGAFEINYPSSSLARSAALADQSYAETYQEQLEARAFNLKMLDGALIQLSYNFEATDLTAARLAFLPSPDLSEYQNDPELYELDVMFAEVIDRRVAAVPLRFDFDPANHIELHHPKAHLTLGMYKNCRIATLAAPTPGLFIDFILRSFYNTALRTHSDELPRRAHRFASTITSKEQQLVYIGVPPSPP
ncbi:DUF2290 domain-containing protein [Mycolicibacterium sp. jd]|uniref:DUF2290 domain-containing protein n=1 Tax=unclassified Mycolicibacterium TaxID=2636767 RepID=UPI00351B3999